MVHSLFGAIVSFWQPAVQHLSNCHLPTTLTTTLGLTQQSDPVQQFILVKSFVFGSNLVVPLLYYNCYQTFSCISIYLFISMIYSISKMYLTYESFQYFNKIETYNLSTKKQIKSQMNFNFATRISHTDST